jgi:hypothetical protein
VTALAGESFPLYRHHGKGLFQDATYRARLGPAVAHRSGWSSALVDFDNDGWKDLFTANSHVNDAIHMFESHSYRLTNSAFRNRGDGTFEDVSAASGLDAGELRAHTAPRRTRPSTSGRAPRSGSIGWRSAGRAGSCRCSRTWRPIRC